MSCILSKRTCRLGVLTIGVLLADHLSAQPGVTLVGAATRRFPDLPVAPGQVVTFQFTGLRTRLPNRVQADVLPLPPSLAGIAMTIRQPALSYTSPPPILFFSSLPILVIEQLNKCADPSAASPECFVTNVTVQIPYGLIVVNPLLGVPSLLGVTEVVLTEGGVPSQSFGVHPVANQVHVITGCDPGPASFSPDRCVPAITRLDGTRLELPSTIKPGEILVLYATGLGVTDPPVATGQAAPTLATVPKTLVRYDFHPNAQPQLVYIFDAAKWQAPLFAGLVPGSVGLYQVNVRIPEPPPGTPACDGYVGTNLTITVMALSYPGSMDGVGVCVDMGK